MSKTIFPKTFWVANGVELLERAAHYGVFIEIMLYLNSYIGFDDITSGWIAAIYAGGIYLLPTFSGALSDKIGYKRALVFAFSFLTVGYVTLAVTHDKFIVIIALIIAMIGGSFIKSVIAGTISKSSNSANRTKAFSIFYAMVNIGSFIGKSIAFPIRSMIGIQYVNLYSAILTIIALIAVIILYKNLNSEGEGKTIKEVWKSITAIITNLKLVSLVIIISGFWIIQNQLYATMPLYVIRMVGEGASPEWISLVNPLVVISLVVLVQNIFKKVKAITAMNIGMLLMPISALIMASGHAMGEITGNKISMLGLFTIHPITLSMVLGIAFQGLAECFISPRYLEYFSKHAPKGDEALYLGFSHLDSFISGVLAFGISGYLLNRYCPDPNQARFVDFSPEQMANVYSHAHYIWFYFAGIAMISAIALYIFHIITKKSEIKEGNI